MIQELDDNYDISVDGMINVTVEQEKGGYKIFNSEFYSLLYEKVYMNILKYENESACKQIFSMKDGKFILEIENELGISYFYSESLDDLID
jgi:hypothetical protein